MKPEYDFTKGERGKFLRAGAEFRLPTRLTHETVTILGMDLERWTHESCIAHFGVGEDWATLYDIRSGEPGKGHATALLREAKAYYEAAGKKFGGTVALNDRMRAIYKRLDIEEYGEE